jgi:hypothetical protein
LLDAAERHRDDATAPLEKAVTDAVTEFRTANPKANQLYEGNGPWPATPGRHQRRQDRWATPGARQGRAALRAGAAGACPGEDRVNAQLKFWLNDLPAKLRKWW